MEKLSLKNNPILGQRGVGMIQVLVLAGIVSVVGLSVGRMGIEMIRAQKRSESSSDYRKKMEEIRILVSSAATCGPMLSSEVNPSTLGLMMNAGQPLTRLNLGGESIIEVDKAYGAIKITGVNVQMNPNPINALPVIIGGVNHSVYRAKLSVSAASVVPSIVSFGSGTDTYTVLMTVSDAGQLANCYEENFDASIVEYSCLMNQGVYQPANGTCDLSTNDKLTQLRDTMGLLQSDIRTTVTNINTMNTSVENQINKLAEDITKRVDDMRTAQTGRINQTNADLDKFKQETTESFVQTGAAILQAYEEIAILNDRHQELVTEVVNLTDVVEENRIQQIENVNIVNSASQAADASMANQINNSNSMESNNFRIVTQRGIAANEKISADQTENSTRNQQLDSKLSANNVQIQGKMNQLYAEIEQNESQQNATNNNIRNSIANSNSANSNAEDSLRNKINANQATQAGVNNAINSNLQTSNQARAAADTDLQNLINSNQAAQVNLNSATRGRLLASNQALAAAQSSLSGKIAQNQSSFQGLSANINSRIAAAAAARNSAVSSINSRIGSLDSSLDASRTKLDDLASKYQALSSRMSNEYGTLAGVDQAGSAFDSQIFRDYQTVVVDASQRSGPARRGGYSGGSTGPSGPIGGDGSTGGTGGDGGDGGDGGGSE